MNYRNNVNFIPRCAEVFPCFAVTLRVFIDAISCTWELRVGSEAILASHTHSIFSKHFLGSSVHQFSYALIAFWI
jgi:hypothetical protein